MSPLPPPTGPYDWSLLDWITWLACVTGVPYGAALTLLVPIAKHSRMKELTSRQRLVQQSRRICPFGMRTCIWFVTMLFVPSQIIIRRLAWMHKKKRNDQNLSIMFV